MAELLRPRGNGGVVNEVICFSALLLVGDVDFSAIDITQWTAEEKARAYDWAMRVHLRASDNPHVRIPPRPHFVPEMEEP